MTASNHIASVNRFANGMVMVFDHGGHQMPKYQGTWKEKREAILRDATPNTEFNGLDEPLRWNSAKITDGDNPLTSKTLPP